MIFLQEMNLSIIFFKATEKEISSTPKEAQGIRRSSRTLSQRVDYKEPTSDFCEVSCL